METARQIAERFVGEPSNIEELERAILRHMEHHISSNKSPLEELAREMNRARAAVVSWMKNEGSEGRLRTNDQAPMWPEYERTQKAFDDAVAKYQ